MPVVTGFRETATSRTALQPTQVEAQVSVLRPTSADPILQINTGGSGDRKFPGKTSQTLQLTRQSALELFEIIRRTYSLN